MYRRAITNMRLFNVYRPYHDGVNNKAHYGKYINTVMTGVEFKKIFHNHISCKVVGLNERGFHYEVGPVVNDEEFYPSGNCSKGGLYFCDATEIGSYWEIYGRNIAMLELPDDARVYIEESKCKTDRFVIQKILSIEEFFEELQSISHSSIISILKRNPLLIEYVKSPTEEMCLTAVENDPKYFDCIDGYVLNNNTNRALGCIDPQYQTPKICERAVKTDERNLKYAKYQTHAMCVSAIERDPDMIKHVRGPTYYLYYLARVRSFFIPVKNFMTKTYSKWTSIFALRPTTSRHQTTIKCGGPTTFKQRRMIIKPITFEDGWNTGTIIAEHNEISHDTHSPSKNDNF